VNGTTTNNVNDTIEAVRSILYDYFQLQLSAKDLYAQWSATDVNFRKRAEGLHGVRLMRYMLLKALTHNVDVLNVDRLPAISRSSIGKTPSKTFSHSSAQVTTISHASLK
jgi:hypothetical protein